MIRTALLALSLSTAAVTADPALNAREQLVAAAALVEAAESARDRVDALTDAVRAYDAGLSALRTELRRLTLRERALNESLADEDGDVSSLLALMQNATLQAETQSLLHPGSAVDTIRAGALASVLVPSLYARAGTLEAELTELEDVRTVIEAAKGAMSDGLAAVQSARVALADALTNRTDLPPRLATNDAAMVALVNSADTLAGLADSLLSVSNDAELVSMGAWAPPAYGRLLAPFAADSLRPGWALATEPRALLTSPDDVTIRYSGDFPDQGKVVILEGDAGRMMLMAGLSTSFVEIGQVVAAGEPLGFAGPGQLAAQDKLNVNGAESSLLGEETLYIEIRQGGAPVDPATILTLEQEQG
ncbi:MAG: peptidoglycan DD-metalloendopeptidase family protein [Pseudomonadota bacterium]